MGWNSWDSFGTTVTEAEVKANADYMAQQSGEARLAVHRGGHPVVGAEPQDARLPSRRELAMDAYGRLIPAPNRFPSSADGKGFKPLADYVHSKGLKFGIHIMRGIPRRAVDRESAGVRQPGEGRGRSPTRQSICPWNTDMYGVDVTKPGGQDYYDSIVKLYASWGLDFIKADDMFGAGPSGDHSSEIDALSKAIKKSRAADRAQPVAGNARCRDRREFIGKHAQMWRISDDFWDRWVDLKRQFPNLAKWSPYVKPGNWPDADMLPLGHIGIRAERGDPRMSLLTHDEQLTLMTLWSIARSPLMFGGHLPDNDEFTLELITNDEVLAVNQKASRSKELFTRDNQVAWVADMAGLEGEVPGGVQHRRHSGEKSASIGPTWDCRRIARCAIYGRRRISGTVRDGQTFKVAPHAAAFYKLTPGK